MPDLLKTMVELPRYDRLSDRHKSNPPSLDEIVDGGRYSRVAGVDQSTSRVTTESLAEAAVTSGKIADEAVTTDKIADTAVGISKFAAGVRAIEEVSSLPSPGDQGRIVLLTTDNQLYRDTGVAWTAAVPATNITGQIDSTQIADFAVTAKKMSVRSHFVY